MKKFYVKTSGEGAPLVMIHGWAMNSAVWWPIRKHLETNFRVSWIDLPGHGLNRDIKADSLDDIIALIQQHIDDASHLLGWSLGGLLVQALAEKFPEKVKTMTLVSSTPKFAQSSDWQNAMGKDALQVFAKNLHDDMTATIKRFIALQFMGVKDSKRTQRQLLTLLLIDDKTVNKSGGVLSQSNLDVSMSALQLGLQILTHSDFRVASIDSQISQHWLFAGRDRLIPPTVINDLKSLRPDAQITLLDTAGHAPFLTNPDEFLEAILVFLKPYS